MSTFKLVKLVDPIQIVLNGVTFTGEYDNATAYSSGDSVSYQGSSYVAIAPTTGNLPTNQTYWQVISEKGDSWQEHFETVSKNLSSYPYVLNYTSGLLTSIVYTLPSGSITKTLNRTSGKLTSIVLSGDTPSGINLTKTLTYSGSQLVGVSYS